MGEQGSAAMVLSAVVALAALVGVLLGDVGLYLRGRTQALSAADAAALAAAPVTFHGFGTSASPEDEAARYAAANGAVLVACDCAVDRSWRPRIVTVAVTVAVELMLFGRREVPAASRAEFDPVSLARPPPPTTTMRDGAGEGSRPG